jgi:lipoprotein-anchoring transpeptidase ErfK/SrfK
VRVAAIVVALFLVAGVTYLLLPGGSSASGQSKDASTPGSTIVATAHADTLAVYAHPADPQPSLTLSPPRTFVPIVVLVRERQAQWLRVLLPVRPNGSEGWVNRSEVDESIVTYSVAVDLSDHHLVVRDGSKLVLDTTVAVGSHETPTPPGLFYLTELLTVPDPTGPYGPYAYGLSGHSLVLENFADGDGQLGLHGTNRPDLMGGDVTHGCIRLRNSDVQRLEPLLPLGTPVDVQA